MHKKTHTFIFLSGQKAAFPGKSEAKRLTNKNANTQTNKKTSGKQGEILVFLGLDLPKLSQVPLEIFWLLQKDRYGRQAEPAVRKRTTHR